MKTKLKHFLNVPLNREESTGKTDVEYMVWSPVSHCWFYPKDDWKNFNTRYRRFLSKQPVVKIGLRNDTKKHIALFLKDYGKEKNRKLKEKFK